MSRRSLVPLVAALAAAAASPLSGQEGRWVLAPQAGYSTALEAGIDGPGGGPALALFVGRRLGSTLVLGVQGGWHRDADGEVAFRTVCPAPLPATDDCSNVSDRRRNTWEGTLVLRASRFTGTWRPTGQVGLGLYRVEERRDYRIEEVANPGTPLPGTAFRDETSTTGAGAHLGAGLEYAPNAGAFSVGLGGRLHGLIDNYFNEGNARLVLDLVAQATLTF